MTHDINSAEEEDLTIKELKEARKLLDNFIERENWKGDFRKRELGFIILKLMNVKENSWRERNPHTST